MSELYCTVDSQSGNKAELVYCILQFKHQTNLVVHCLEQLLASLALCRLLQLVQVNRCKSELNTSTTSSQYVVNQLVDNEGKYVCLPVKYKKITNHITDDLSQSNMIILTDVGTFVHSLIQMTQNNIVNIIALCAISNYYDDPQR